MEQLQADKLVNFSAIQIPSSAVVTPRGWNYAAQIETIRNPHSRQAFVAMSFDEDLRNIWDDGLKPAIEQAGYEPVRVDQIEHNNSITDEILSGIIQSRFVVCDFTRHKHGVYFEAGFAMGLKRPVILCCNKDDIGDAHFDTRNHNHIVWETVDELYQKLIYRIIATIY